MTWDEGADFEPALMAALSKLADHTGPDPWVLAADPVMDQISDDVDYGYRTYAMDHGYWPLGVPVLPVLARIAAAHRSDAATIAAVELIESIVHAPMDRPGATDAELDAWIDGLSAALRQARPALAEAARLVPAIRSRVAALAEHPPFVGSYEPRWRGVARELARLPGESIRAAGGRLVVGGRSFVDPESGAVVTAPLPPRRRLARARPRPAWTVGFVDAEGPGALTAEGPGRVSRGPVWLWRPGTATVLRSSPPQPGTATDPCSSPPQPGTSTDPRSSHPGIFTRLRSWPLRPGVTSLAADDGGVYIGYTTGVVTRLGGPSLRVPAPKGYQRLHAYRHGAERRLMAVTRDRMHSLDFARGEVTEMAPFPFDHAFAAFELDGRPCFAVVPIGPWPPSSVLRLDARSGEPAAPPIPVHHPEALCAYELDGRSMLAVGSGRLLHRFDATSGEPAGPPLTGHRRDITGITVLEIAGRPTLFTVDGSALRRWDAADGTPWPAGPRVEP